MPSIFMMNYVHKINVDSSDIPFINDAKLQDEIITGYNAVVKKFKSLGYNYIHGGGARPCDIKTSYKCLLNYENHDCGDPLSDKFKKAITMTCEKHKIII